MNNIDPEIKKGFFNAVESGDLPRLKSLIHEFPESFEQLRYDKLVDSAFDHRQAETLLYLTIAQGLEVSPDFEKAKKFRMAAATGEDEYRQTLEVTAAAIFNFAHESRGRSIACYKFRDLVHDLNTKGIASAKAFMDGSDTPLVLNPSLLPLIQDGSLESFIEKMHADERCGMGHGHDVRMIQTVYDHKEALPLLANLIPSQEVQISADVTRQR